MVLVPLPGYRKAWFIPMPLRSLLAFGGGMATACTSQGEADRAQEKEA